MTGFSADWLALREPADHRARNAALIDAVAARFRAQNRIAVIDLACGRGSTLRALLPHLPQGQSWTLVDSDAALLSDAARMSRDIPIQTRRADLERELEDVLDAPADLVTTSAFFDLVSENWLRRLASTAAARRLPVYAALSYDGRMCCAPHDESDEAVCAVFNRHQRRDKGLGNALGADAAASAGRIFAEHGFDVRQGPSDWQLTPQDHDLQRLLITGWHDAVAEMGELAAERLANWRDRRLAWVARGESTITVGHADILALPAT